VPDIAGDAGPAESPRVGGLRRVAGATVVPAARQVRILQAKFILIQYTIYLEDSNMSLGAGKQFNSSIPPACF
jgi:hypothetical protein